MQTAESGGIMPIKSKDELIKANLAKTFNKIKLEVAESEEFWLNCFDMILPTLIDSDQTEQELVVQLSKTVTLCDLAVEEWEKRWGRNAKS